MKFSNDAPARPDDAAGSATDRLFSDPDSYLDRFRDIQLRFIDGPQQATADAAGLLSAAVDQLTQALAAKQAQLSSAATDTEGLRLELRGYRDLLHRLIAV